MMIGMIGMGIDVTSKIVKMRKIIVMINTSSTIWKFTALIAM